VDAALAGLHAMVRYAAHANRSRNIFLGKTKASAPALDSAADIAL
jgi:hypothetical protein